MKKWGWIAAAAMGILAAPGLAPVAHAQTDTTAAASQAPAPLVEKVSVPTGPPAELQKLAILNGTWTTKSHTFASAMGPESDYAGKSSYKWIMNGMHLEGSHEFHIAGKPNSGRSTWGWDPERKQYQIVWVDAMFPAAMVYYGTFAGDNVMVLFSTYLLQGKAVTEKLTFTFSGSDAFSMVMEGDMSGEMKKLMEQTCSKVKATAKKPAAKKPATTTKPATTAKKG